MICGVLNCNSYADDTELGLCGSHSAAFRRDAAKAAEALERGDEGAEKQSRRILTAQARFAMRVVCTEAGLTRRIQPQPKLAAAAPSADVLSGLIQGEKE